MGTVNVPLVDSVSRAVCCRHGCLLVSFLLGRVEAGRITRGIFNPRHDSYHLVAAHATIHANHTAGAKYTISVCCITLLDACMVHTKEGLNSYGDIMQCDRAEVYALVSQPKSYRASSLDTNRCGYGNNTAQVRVVLCLRST